MARRSQRRELPLRLRAAVKGLEASAKVGYLVGEGQAPTPKQALEIGLDATSAGLALWGGTQVPKIHARQAATQEALTSQAAKPRPGAASGMVTKDGQVFSGSSGRQNPLNETVQGMLDQVPPNQRSPFHGGCAEMSCLSNAIEAGANPRGGVMSTVKVGAPGSPRHGQPFPPCSSCSYVQEQLGITTVEGK